MPATKTSISRMIARPSRPAARRLRSCSRAMRRSASREASNGVRFCRTSNAQARDVERGDAAGRATLREQEAAVLLEHPAHGPHDVVARPAADVRDVEAVAHDAHAAARDALRARRPRRVAEPGRLEGALQVGGGDLVAERRQRVVHARLLVGPRRDRDPAVLAGGDDVERRVGVVAGARGRGAGEQRDERRDQGASRRGGAGHEANSPAPCARSHAKMTPASTLERETSA